MLVGVAATPAEAATGCDAPDTTWVGPATQAGFASWAEPTNWTNGVPTVESVVCIPTTASGPLVAEETRAEAGVVTLEGTLTVEGTLAVATLEGDFGELHGPGTTTVTGRLSGYWLAFQDAAVVDLRANAALGGELFVADGSRLNVQGDAVLEPDARIDSLSDNPGLFTITPTGSLTFESANESAEVIGGFANHGDVSVTAGYVLMLGASPEDAHPDQFSTGTFTGAPEATFNVSNTELRDGARIDHATWVDHMTVPVGNTATVSDSTVYWDPAEPEPNLAGAGNLVVTDDSTVGGRIGGSLTISVPAGERVRMADAVVQDQARVLVHGELQGADINLDDQAVLDVYGVHRVGGGGGLVDFTGTDPGLEIIRPGGELLTDADDSLSIVAPFVNQGTVDAGTGFIYLGPRVESPSPSSGTLRADPTGTLLLGSNVEGEPPLVLDAPVIQGTVHVSGDVRSGDAQIRGDISTVSPGRLGLTGITTLTDGASIAGDVVVGGQLQADVGATGTATLRDAEVTGRVTALSGTLSVPSLSPTTRQRDGTLASGQWHALPSATLDLPAITTNDAKLTLEGPGASFGGLTALDNGPNGTVNLRGGADLRLPGRFRNEGLVHLSPRSRLITGAMFRQFATGRLVTEVEAAGLGRVRAEGRRDLAGELVVQRDPSYEPSVDTVLTFLVSNGRAEPDDAFDSVVSPKFGSRKFRVLYELDHVRLWVDRVG